MSFLGQRDAEGALTKSVTKTKSKTKTKKDVDGETKSVTKTKAKTTRKRKVTEPTLEPTSEPTPVQTEPKQLSREEALSLRKNDGSIYASIPKIKLRARPRDTSTLSWNEKYRPISVDEVVGKDNRSGIRKIEDFLKDYDSGNLQAKLGLIVYGPPGCGMTCAVNCIAESMGHKVVEMPTNCKGNIIQSRVIPAMVGNSLFVNKAHRNVILIEQADDPEHISKAQYEDLFVKRTKKQDQLKHPYSGILHPINVNIMKDQKTKTVTKNGRTVRIVDDTFKYVRPAPLIMIVHDLYAKNIADLRKAKCGNLREDIKYSDQLLCEVAYFNRVDQDACVRRLNQILGYEGYKLLQPELIKLLHTSSNGDMRRAITMLEEICRGADTSYFIQDSDNIKDRIRIVETDDLRRTFLSLKTRNFPHVDYKQIFVDKIPQELESSVKYLMDLRQTVWEQIKLETDEHHCPVERLNFLTKEGFVQSDVIVKVCRTMSGFLPMLLDHEENQVEDHAIKKIKLENGQEIVNNNNTFNSNDLRTEYDLLPLLGSEDSCVKLFNSKMDFMSTYNISKHNATEWTEACFWSHYPTIAEGRFTKTPHPWIEKNKLKNYSKPTNPLLGHEAKYSFSFLPIPEEQRKAIPTEEVEMMNKMAIKTSRLKNMAFNREYTDEMDVISAICDSYSDSDLFNSGGGWKGLEGLDEYERISKFVKPSMLLKHPERDYDIRVFFSRDMCTSFLQYNKNMNDGKSRMISLTSIFHTGALSVYDCIVTLKSILGSSWNNIDKLEEFTSQLEQSIKEKAKIEGQHGKKLSVLESTYAWSRVALNLWFFERRRARLNEKKEEKAAQELFVIGAPPKDPEIVSRELLEAVRIRLAEALVCLGFNETSIKNLNYFTSVKAGRKVELGPKQDYQSSLSTKIKTAYDVLRETGSSAIKQADGLTTTLYELLGDEKAALLKEPEKKYIAPMCE